MGFQERSAGGRQRGEGRGMEGRGREGMDIDMGEESREDSRIKKNKRGDEGGR